MSTCNRDTQRSKVYEWERHCSTTLQHIHNGQIRCESLNTAEFETLQECAAYMNSVWAAESVRYGVRNDPPGVGRPARGQLRALAFAKEHRITVPKSLRSRWILLHEAAHCLNIGRTAHGMRFVGILIGLLARQLGYDPRQLMQEADRMGVQYDARAIGAVPRAAQANAHLTYAKPNAPAVASHSVDKTEQTHEQCTC